MTACATHASVSSQSVAEHEHANKQLTFEPETWAVIVICHLGII
jgi:hypothetical protein